MPSFWRCTIGLSTRDVVAGNNRNLNQGALHAAACQSRLIGNRCAQCRSQAFLLCMGLFFGFLE
jgi:hypothetical protein